MKIKKLSRGLDKFPKSQQGIFDFLLRTTFVIGVLLTSLLVVSIFTLHNSYVTGRLIWCLFGLAFLGVIFILNKYSRFKLSTWLLICFYYLLACSIVLMWSIYNPAGILIFAFLILIAGMLLGARYIPPIAAIIIATLFIVQFIHNYGLFVPDRSSLNLTPSFGDILAYSTLFGVFAIVGWLTKSQIEYSLSKLAIAERRLKRHSVELASQLRARTRELELAQKEEMKNLYKFAELGQLTTLIVHDLANNLNVLALDIGEVKSKKSQSPEIIRAMESISYLDNLVEDLRQRLRENTSQTRFNLAPALTSVFESLKKKANSSNLSLEFVVDKELSGRVLKGDELRLTQCLRILVNNAIDACVANGSVSQPSIIGRAKLGRNDSLVIYIKDFGTGIPDTLRTRLFTPVKSTKQDGLGLGLFMAKQIIEGYFQGDISLLKSPRTTFKVTIPLNSD